jgi:hypothetical protein
VWFASSCYRPSACGLRHACATILDALLTYWRYEFPADRKQVRTTNASERRFRAVRRRTDAPAHCLLRLDLMDHSLFAVFKHENRSQGVNAPLLLRPNLLSPNNAADEFCAALLRQKIIVVRPSDCDGQRAAAMYSLIGTAN